MKKLRNSKKFLEQLELVPIVSLACEKTGLSRNTVYRWRKEDPHFAREMDEASKKGVKSINDLAESKLINNIQLGKMEAIRYWLDNNKRNYARPRPKDFWTKAIPQGITGFEVRIVKTKEQLEKLRRLEELEKKYEKNAEPQDDVLSEEIVGRDN